MFSNGNCISRATNCSSYKYDLQCCLPDASVEMCHLHPTIYLSPSANLIPTHYHRFPRPLLSPRLAHFLLLRQTHYLSRDGRPHRLLSLVQIMVPCETQTDRLYSGHDLDEESRRWNPPIHSDLVLFIEFLRWRILASHNLTLLRSAYWFRMAMWTFRVSRENDAWGSPSSSSSSSSSPLPSSSRSSHSSSSGGQWPMWRCSASFLRSLPSPQTE
jgi:hypothetical protein